MKLRRRLLTYLGPLDQSNMAAACGRSEKKAPKHNFSLDQTSLQLETEGILAQSFQLEKSLQEGYKTGKLSHSETSLSRNVHYLICQCFEQLDADARFNGFQYEEISFTDHETGHLIWEKITEVLGEGKLSQERLQNTLAQPLHVSVSFEERGM